MLYYNRKDLECIDMEDMISVVVPGGEYSFSMKGPCISRPESHAFQFVGIDKR
jgi:hypothetical protein